MWNLVKKHGKIWENPPWKFRSKIIELWWIFQPAMFDDRRVQGGNMIKYRGRPFPSPQTQNGLEQSWFKAKAPAKWVEKIATWKLWGRHHPWHLWKPFFSIFLKETNGNHWIDPPILTISVGQTIRTAMFGSTRGCLQSLVGVWTCFELGTHDQRGPITPQVGLSRWCSACFCAHRKLPSGTFT